jgi:hypothetical protein
MVTIYSCHKELGYTDVSCPDGIIVRDYKAVVSADVADHVCIVRDDIFSMRPWQPEALLDTAYTPSDLPSSDYVGDADAPRAEPAEPAEQIPLPDASAVN